MANSDTIVAVATAAGVGGIAVVRLSGRQALPVALRCLSVERLEPRRATYCRFAEIDDVVAVYMPRGYSGEPTVEISLHGSRYLQQEALRRLCAAGARLAEPGEYTLRAFLNGRLNLSQAEAVGDLIAAATPAQHRLAVSQLRGGYADELRRLRAELVDLTALLELELDFSQEDVEFAERTRLQATVQALGEKVRRLVQSFGTGNAVKEGVPVAIVGRPNAGKSSLLNALVGDDRAIVSPIAGTTRDTVEETMTLGGITYRFIDTAGLRSSDDPIEQMGFDRAVRAAQRARVILFVRDVCVPFGKAALDDVAYITERCDMREKHLFVVHNKCDMPHVAEPPGHLVSATERTGIEELKQAVAAAVQADADRAGEVLLTNERHYAAMQAMLAALEEVSRGLADGTPTDLVAVDLRDALYHLGTITGEVATDELLGSIFSRFCVGK